MSVKKIILITIGFVLYLTTNLMAQEQQIIKDTLFLTNKGSKVRVVNTIIRQFYNDSNCIWEIKYPQLSGLPNTDVERTLNVEFIENADLGNCNDKGCEDNIVYFKQISRYWDVIEIVSLGNNLVCYKTKEGTCLNDTKQCMHNTHHYIVDLNTGYVVTDKIRFKNDAVSQQRLEDLLIKNLGFKPKDLNALTSLQQYYLKDGKLHFFYDVYTLTKGDKEYDVTLDYDTIEDLLKDKSLFLNY